MLWSLIFAMNFLLPSELKFLTLKVLCTTLIIGKNISVYILEYESWKNL